MIYAHAGHWLVNLLYAAPLLFVVAIIVRDRLRQRRDDARGALPDEATLAGPMDTGAGGER
jgi:hypothetical protein